jgi:DNA-binding MarR family transcriptional regulator
MNNRDELIGRIVASQHRMRHLMTANPSNPLLHSTLTMQQLKVLLVLSHNGDLSGQELASAMGVGLATMTGIVDRIVAAGLVERHEDLRDRRVRRARLTDAGRDIVDGIINAGEASLLALLHRLSDDELGVVERASNLIMDAAAAQLAELHPSLEPSMPAPPVPRGGE